MLYDTYRQKVQLHARRLRKGLRIAALCLLVLCVVFSLLAAFEACRGILTAGLSDQTVTYGDKVRLDAAAFACPVTYEVSAAPDTWEPITALPVGEYRVRGYTENRFGIRRYTDPVTVTVLEKELTLTVSARTWNYGEFLPHTEEDLEPVGLVFGDRVAKASFLADSAMPGEVTVSLVGDTLRIENESGTDVTSCYRITTKDGPGLIENHLTLTAYSAAKTYDGTPLSQPFCYVSRGKLFDGHILSAEVKGTVTDAGDVENTIVSYTITDKFGEDMSSLYTVKTEAGTLEITPCLIEISTGSASGVYNGRPISCSDYWVSDGALPDGCRIEVEMHNTMTERGSLLNSFDNVKVFRTVNGEVIDITHNCKIVAGKIGVLKIY